MPGSDKTFDVFISHNAHDADLAREIANLCISNGLSAFTLDEVGGSDKYADAIWDALSESKAVVAIFSASGTSPQMAVELGGARAWNKPIFGILADPARNPAPVGLGPIHLYTPGRIEDVVRAIKTNAAGLNESERAALASTWSELDVSVDQLALDPQQLSNLVRRFKQKSGKIASGEQLLSELLRMRKQGKLRRPA